MFRARLFIFCIAAVLLLCPPAWGRQQPPPVFKDIAGSFAEDDINALAALWILKGSSPEQFDPQREITRGDFTVLLAGVLGIMPYHPEKPSFFDVPPDSPVFGYVEALAELGILAGSGDNRLEAGKFISRQDAAVMVYKALGGFSASRELKYRDGRIISPYAVSGVAFVTGKGWMRGSDGNFHPLKSMTRAEAAVLARQLYDARKWQAMTSIRDVSRRRAGVETGAELPLQTDPAWGKLGFTPIYGIDNPALGNLGYDGTFTAGQRPGDGIITVNSGYNSYNVEVSVSGNIGKEDADKPSAEKSSAGVNSSGGYGPPVERELSFTYSMGQYASDAAFRDMENKKYSGPVDGLTSGGEIWTGFLRQQGRNITADLGHLETVSKISLEFKQDTGAGIRLPEYMECAVSVDGEIWRYAGRVNHGILPSDSSVQSKSLQLTIPPVIARYVKISFPVDVFVFARHLSIKGGLPADKPAVLPPDERGVGKSPQYLFIPDMKDVLLVFSGANGRIGTWTSWDFEPLVGYMNGRGAIGGRMFDTMLFLPFPGITGNKGEWVAYLDNLFVPGEQLSALNDAAASVNAALHTQMKEKVILSLPYPDPQQKDFGALEEEGRSLSFIGNNASGEQAPGDRFQAVQWYYNQLTARWKAAEYKNLELSGIYWYKETMDARISGEKDLLQNVARMVRQDGLKFFWIPYFGGRGYEDWRSYGFSHVILQPNYYATDNPPEDRLANAVEQAGKYSLGIELECDDKITYSRYYYDLFYRQLNIGHELGLDGDVTNAYYAGAKTFLQVRSSNVPQIRGIYDDLFRWINGTYKPE
ncbi:MAG: hypothetical protein VR69_04395 [Peptococcaceae bacterium BRH_c4b]|nr:MAG: hypothetical protein VR69_04395 [Peptococcaceae bacterium BRH_c4b]